MYPSAYVEYLVQFHAYRDYFECHEILENYWKEQDPTNETWVKLIQLAVAMYHHRRQNVRGAQKLVTRTCTFVLRHPDAFDTVGIHAGVLYDQLCEQATKLERMQPYEPIILPIQDAHLYDLCIAQCAARGVKWNRNSPVSETIIHKHQSTERVLHIRQRMSNKKKRGC